MATNTTHGTHVEEGTYVLAAEAANILGITQRRVTQIVEQGKLPAVKVHTAVLIPVEAVIQRRDWLIERKREQERKQALRQQAAEQA